MEIFLAFGWVFWAAALLTIAALATASVNESPGWFVIALLGGGTALLFTTGNNLIDAWNYLLENPVSVLQWAALYIGIGVVYAAFRYYQFLRDLRLDLINFRSGLPLADRDAPLSEDNLKLFKRDHWVQGSVPPRVSEHKDRIMAHMILWSFSWVELRPLTKLFNFVYGSIAGALQRMSDRMFNGLT